MFSTEAATLRKLNLFRQAWEKRKILYGDGFLGIAKVKLDLTSGKIKQTSQDTAHYSLWPYVNSRLERNVISVKGA
jgi:hypothetical protein